MGLFRKQAIEHQHSYLWGEVSLTQSVRNNTVFYLFVSLFLCIGIFLTVGEYNQKETVTGLLEPSTGISETRSPRSGVIKHLYVEEGSYVSKGDPLFQVINDTSIVPGLSHNHVRLAHLNRKREILGQLILNKNTSLKNYVNSNNSKIAGVEQKLLLLKAEAMLLRQELALSEAEANRQKELRKKHLTTKTSENHAIEKWLSVKYKVSNNRFSTLDLESTLASLHNNELEYSSTNNDYLFELEAQLLGIEEEITQQQVTSSIVVVAQSNGVVSSLNLKVGMPISQNEYVMSIIPDNDKLIARLFIPTRAIGFVSPKQNIIIKLDAFPYQKYGPISASLTSISSNVLPGNKSHRVLSLSEPVYKSIAKLDQQFIKVNDQEINLQAGMLFSADIIISKRTLAEWLFAPIIGALK